MEKQRISADIKIKCEHCGGTFKRRVLRNKKNIGVAVIMLLQQRNVK